MYGVGRALQYALPEDGCLQSAVCALVHWSCGQTLPNPSANGAVALVDTRLGSPHRTGDVRGGLVNLLL